MKLFDSIRAHSSGRKTAGATPASGTAGTAPIPASDSLTDEAIYEIVQRHLGPQRVGANQLELAPAVPVPPNLIELEGRSIPMPISKEQLATVRALADDWQRGLDGLSEFGGDRITAALALSQKRIADAHAAGEADTAAPTYDQIAAEFAQRRAAVKTTMVKASMQAGELFTEAAGKVIAHLRLRAEHVAVAEFRDYARLGVHWEPSRLTRTYLSAASSLERTVSKFRGPGAGLGHNPKTMFAMIGIDL